MPVICTRAFLDRYMQLNPVDQKEVHFIRPGNPDGTYSDMLIDTLFEVVKNSNFLIDSHAGEMAQALYSWVPVPMWGSEDMQEKSLSLTWIRRGVHRTQIRRKIHSAPLSGIAGSRDSEHLG